MKLDQPAQVRLGLQRRAPLNLRRHVQRAVMRLVVLVAADLAAFALMRELIRAVRNRVLLGDWVADSVQAPLPGGYLNGWQFAAALLVGLFATGNYGPGDQRRDPRRLFAACGLAAALPLWMTIWTRGLELVLVQYTLTVLLVWIGVVAERLTIHRIVAGIRRAAQDAADTLFVGSASECRRTAASPAFASGTDYRGLGFVDVADPPAPGALGHLRDFPLLLAASGAEVVVVCGYLSDESFQDVVDTALSAGCQLLGVPRATEMGGVQPNLVWRQGQPLIELTTPRLRSEQLVLKRLVDLVIACVGLLLAWPMMLAVAAAIRWDSAGPVLFRQERIGSGGRRFRVWKFRTMYAGASDAAHRELVGKMLRGDEQQASQLNVNGEQVFKLVNDDRVTRVGRWLRRTSLDELPQLLNVLRGEMSLVGPRPPLPYEFEVYDHWQFDRLQVRPGITGLWQVSGRSLLTYRQMCELDLEYVRRWSLWLDFKILLKTIPAVLLNSGRAA